MRSSPPARACAAQVHKATASVAENDDLDLDAALAACVQLGLAGPHLAPPEPAARPPLTASAFGMHLHAATPVDGRDRKQLERVCRYMLRPPFAKFIARLCALVSPPGFHMTRYFGVFANRHHLRPRIIQPSPVLHGARAPPRPHPPAQVTNRPASVDHGPSGTRPAGKFRPETS